MTSSDLELAWSVGSMRAVHIGLACSGHRALLSHSGRLVDVLGRNLRINGLRSTDSIFIGSYRSSCISSCFCRKYSWCRSILLLKTRVIIRWPLVIRRLWDSLLIIIVGAFTDWIRLFAFFFFAFFFLWGTAIVSILVLVVLDILPVHIIDVECISKLRVQILITLLVIVTTFLFLNFFHLFVQVFKLIHHFFCLRLKIVL